MRPRALVLATLLMTATALAAQTPAAGNLPDAAEILKRADAACRAVQAVAYDVAFAPDEAGASMVPAVKGSYTLERDAGPRPGRFRAEIEVQRPDTTAVQRFTFVADGARFSVVDPQAKQVRTSAEVAALNPMNEYVLAGLMLEFVYEAPFDDELSGKVEVKPDADVAGEECHVVHVVYNIVGAPDATWFFAKKDFLPRRRIDHHLMPNGKTAALQKTITNLTVDPPVDDNTFKVEVPEGYTQIDE